MMSGEELLQYKLLESKFNRTCFTIADMIREYVPEFPLFADWKVSLGKVYTYVDSDTAYVFPSILLELDKETIEGLLKDDPSQVYYVMKIGRLEV